MNLHVTLIGRFGNQLFQYCAARKLAELNGMTLTTPSWIGERIFDVMHPLRQSDHQDTVFEGYAQRQEDLRYSRREVLQWLMLKPELKAKLDSFVPSGEIVAHLRRGDYEGYGYCLVSKQSYRQAAEKFGFNPDDIVYVSEEEPLTHPDFTGELAFLPDFYRMMKAKVLFRANSSFSWWASALGEAMTFSPDIRGKPGGVESDCEFQWGNACQLSELPNMSDLHLFHESQRYDYRLNKMCSVIDIGGYSGDFAFEIERRYGCNVTIYEASLPFTKRIQERITSTHKIELRNAAVGRDYGWLDIHIKGDMTGAFADGPIERCPMMDAASLDSAELLKINCEGGEYDILERLLETDRAKEYDDIQVQFHTVAPDWLNRYKAIHEGLKRTHRLTFDAPFCWQNWELRA